MVGCRRMTSSPPPGATGRENEFLEAWKRYAEPAMPSAEQDRYFAEMREVALRLGAGDVPATYADISATQRDLGFDPATPIEAGIPKFVAWYKAYYGIA